MKDKYIEEFQQLLAQSAAASKSLNERLFGGNGEPGALPTIIKSYDALSIHLEDNHKNLVARLEDNKQELLTKIGDTRADLLLRMETKPEPPSIPAIGRWAQAGMFILALLGLKK